MLRLIDGVWVALTLAFWLALIWSVASFVLLALTRSL